MDVGEPLCGSSAEKGGFLALTALADERAGNFFAESNEKRKAMSYLTEAVARYDSRGGYAKRITI